MVLKPSEEEGKFFAKRAVEERKATERAAELEEIRRKEAEAVAKRLGVEDVDLAAQLVDLGFGAEMVGVFSLIPLVYVAWADGDVSSAERNSILEIAKNRGASEESEGYAFLQALLERKPRDDFFETCLRTLKALYDQLQDEEAETARQDLVSLSLMVANASGGFLGLFGAKVSVEERQIIDDINHPASVDQADGSGVQTFG